MTDEEYRERFRQRSCAGKVRHTSAADAFYVSLLTWKLKHGHAWPYQCGFCEGWHTGRVPPHVKAFIDELAQCDEFLKMQGFTVRPMTLKAYEPMRMH